MSEDDMIPMREGTQDDGKEYEYQIIVLLAAGLLKLDVEDFTIMTNVAGPLIVDDIVIRCKFREKKEEEILLFQVKHSMKKLWVSNKEKKTTSIKKQIEFAFIPLPKIKDDVVMFRKRDTDGSLMRKQNEKLRQKLLGVSEISFYIYTTTNGVDVKVDCSDLRQMTTSELQINQILILFQAEDVYHCTLDDPNSEERNRYLNQQKLYIISGQPTSDNINKRIVELLSNKLFNVKSVKEIITQVEKFMNCKPLCRSMSKTDFELICMQQLLWPCILTDINQVNSISDDMQNFWCDALSLYNVTEMKDPSHLPLMADYYQREIRKLDETFDWFDCYSDNYVVKQTIRDAVKTRYACTILSLKELLVVLWKFDGLPLIIKSEKTAKLNKILNAYKHLDKQFVVLTNSKITFPEGLRVFANASDLSEEMLRVVGNINVSLQGREFIPLADIVLGTLLKHHDAETNAPIHNVPSLLNCPCKNIWSAVTSTHILSWSKSPSDDNNGNTNNEDELSSTDDNDVDNDADDENKNKSPFLIGKPLKERIEYYVERKFYNSPKGRSTNRNKLDMNDMNEEDHVSEETQVNVELLEEFSEDVMVSSSPGLTMISNVPGMGKTTVLHSLALKYDRRNYVISYNSSDCLDDFGNTKIRDEINTKPINYFFRKIEGENCDDLVRVIFEEHSKHDRLGIFIDSFDETLPNYGHIILSMVGQFLRIPNARVFITTRIEAEQRLAGHFKRCSITRLSELTNEDIDGYCSKYGISPGDLHRFNYDFLRNPLHLQMLVSVYEQIEDKSNVTVLKLYREFIEKKMNIYYEKRSFNNDVIIHTTGEVVREQFMEVHKKLALVHILEKSETAKYKIIKDDDINKVIENFNKNMYSLGLVSSIKGKENIQFTHKTYAEYLVAVWLYENKEREFFTDLCAKVYKKNTYAEVANFLNQIVNVRNNVSIIAVINDDLNKLRELRNAKDKSLIELDEFGRYPLHLAGWYGQLDKNGGESLKLLHNYVYQTNPDSLLVKDIYLKFTFLSYLDIGMIDLDTTALEEIDRKCEDGVNVNNIFVTRGDEEVYVGDTRKKISDIWALHYAATHVWGIDVFKKLLKNGADPYRRDLFDKNALELAISEVHSTDLLSILLEHGVNPSKRDQDGQNSLHHAVSTSFRRLNRAMTFTPLSDTIMKVKILLDAGLEPNTRDYHGRNALHCASMSTSFDAVKIIKLLINRGVNLNDRDYKGKHCLEYAVGFPSKGAQVIATLLEAGISPKEKFLDGMLCLHHIARCISKDSAKTLRMLLEKFGVDGNIEDEEGNTPLHHAVSTNSADPLEKVKCLLKANACPSKTNNFKRHSLHEALLNKPKLQFEIVNLFLERGTDPTKTDQEGKNCLHHAKSASKEVVEILLEKGVDPNIIDDKKRNALHYAVMGNSLENIKLLLQHVNDKNAQDEEGKNCLLLALEHNADTVVVEELLNAGVDPKQTDKSNKNSLHYAAVRSKSDTSSCVKQLLSFGVDPDVKDKDEKIPLHYAVISMASFSSSTVEVVLGVCKDPKVKDKYQRNCLHYAASVINTCAAEIVQMLLNRSVDPREKDYEGKNALHHAALSNFFNSLTIVELLLAEGIDPNECDNEEKNCLHHAAFSASYDSAKKVRMLLQRIDDITAVDNKKRHCLHYAALSTSDASVVKVKLLLEAGLDPNQIDNEGRNCLHLVTFNDEHKNVWSKKLELFLNCDVDPIAKDIKGRHCLHYIMLSNAYYPTELIEKILTKGVDPNEKDIYGKNCFHYAAEGNIRESSRYLKILLEKVVDVGEIDVEHKNYLHLAALSGSLGSSSKVKDLLEMGINPTEIDTKGRNCLHYAAMSKSNDAAIKVKLLLDWGVDPTKRDCDGKTPIDLAASVNNHSLPIPSANPREFKEEKDQLTENN